MTKQKVLKPLIYPVISGLVTFFILFLKFKFLDQIPELFIGGHKFGLLVENVLGGVLASIVFYIFTSSYPAYRNIKSFITQCGGIIDDISSPLICFVHRLTETSMLEAEEFALSKYKYKQLLTKFSADSVIPITGIIARYHENKETVLEELMGAVQHSAENISFLKDLIINLKIDDAELIQLVRKCEQSRVQVSRAITQAMNNSKNPIVLSDPYSEFCSVVSELCCYVRRYG